LTRKTDKNNSLLTRREGKKRRKSTTRSTPSWAFAQMLRPNRSKEKKASETEGPRQKGTRGKFNTSRKPLKKKKEKLRGCLPGEKTFIQTCNVKRKKAGSQTKTGKMEYHNRSKPMPPVTKDTVFKTDWRMGERRGAGGERTTEPAHDSKAPQAKTYSLENN